MRVPDGGVVRAVADPRRDRFVVHSLVVVARWGPVAAKIMACSEPVACCALRGSFRAVVSAADSGRRAGAGTGTAWGLQQTRWHGVCEKHGGWPEAPPMQRMGGTAVAGN